MFEWVASTDPRSQSQSGGRRKKAAAAALVGGLAATAGGLAARARGSGSQFTGLVPYPRNTGVVPYGQSRNQISTALVPYGQSRSNATALVPYATGARTNQNYTNAARAYYGVRPMSSTAMNALVRAKNNTNNAKKNNTKKGWWGWKAGAFSAAMAAALNRFRLQRALKNKNDTVAAQTRALENKNAAITRHLATLADTRRALANKRATIGVVQATANSLQSKVALLQTQLSTRNAYVGRLQNQLAAVLKTAKKTKRVLTNSQSTASSQRTQLGLFEQFARAMAANLARLQSNLQNRNARIASLESNVRNAKNMAEDRLGTINELQSNIVAARRDIGKLTEERLSDKARIDLMENANQRFLDSIYVVSSQLRHMTKDRNNLERSLEKARRAAGKAMQTIKNRNSNLASTRAALTKYSTAAKVLANELDMVKRKAAAEVEAVTARMNAQVKALSTAGAEKNATIQLLKAELGTLKNIAGKAKAQNATPVPPPPPPAPAQAPTPVSVSRAAAPPPPPPPMPGTRQDPHALSLQRLKRISQAILSQRGQPAGQRAVAKQPSTPLQLDRHRMVRAIKGVVNSIDKDDPLYGKFRAHLEEQFEDTKRHTLLLILLDAVLRLQQEPREFFKELERILLPILLNRSTLTRKNVNMTTQPYTYTPEVTAAFEVIRSIINRYKSEVGKDLTNMYRTLNADLQKTKKYKNKGVRRTFILDQQREKMARFPFLQAKYIPRQPAQAPSRSETLDKLAAYVDQAAVVTKDSYTHVIDKLKNSVRFMLETEFPRHHNLAEMQHLPQVARDALAVIDDFKKSMKNHYGSLSTVYKRKLQQWIVPISTAVKISNAERMNDKTRATMYRNAYYAIKDISPHLQELDRHWKRVLEMQEFIRRIRSRVPNRSKAPTLQELNLESINRIGVLKNAMIANLSMADNQKKAPHEEIFKKMLQASNQFT